jgi:hypothetical protein
MASGLGIAMGIDTFFGEEWLVLNGTTNTLNINRVGAGTFDTLMATLLLLASLAMLYFAQDEFRKFRNAQVI